MTLRNAFADLATQATAASIDAKTPALVSGATPVSLPSAQVTAMTPPAAITGFALESTAASALAKLNAGLAVTGSFYQATQPVSFTWAGLTDTQLRASAVPVSATSLPLPTGAATAAAQATLLSAVGSPLQAGGTVSVSNLPATQAISAVALPLPTGAATASGQAAIVAALGNPMQSGDGVSILGSIVTDIQSSALPVGASTSSAQDASNALMLEMLSEVAQVLNAILDRLPRTDANHRAVINTSDQGNVTVALAATQTLTTVTTVGTASDVTRLNTLGIGTTARPTDGIPVQMSRIGSLHLLNQIIMS